MRRSILVLSLFLIATSACHRTGAESDGAGAGGQVITAEEIAQSQAATAYDAVLKLRGNFLSNRGKTTLIGNSSPVPNVYLDGVLYGEPTQLRNIQAKTVSMIRLYRAWEATTKFGSGNMGGVIEVITRVQ